MVREIKDDQMLHLINSFEPVPLYPVMGKKGFKHAVEKRGNEWHTWFWKDGVTVSEVQDNPETPSSDQKSERVLIAEIDVRGLEPPEPMIKILATLNRLDDETTLLVHHHREPMLLYEKLEELGYEAKTEKIEESYYKVRIQKSK